MTQTIDQPLKTSLDVLEEHFGITIGPSEIEAIRSSTGKDLMALLDRLDNFYNSPRGFPARSAKENRVFPIMFNYRDIGDFCHKHWKADTEDEPNYWMYLKHLELPAEILKLLLYYDSVLVVDPVSIVFMFDYYRRRDDYKPEEVAMSLANSAELMVPLSQFIKEQTILLFPKWSSMHHIGSTLELDQLECEDQLYQKICERYHIRKTHEKPYIFVGGIYEYEALATALENAGVPISEDRLYAALINGYLAFSADVQADFIAQNSWTWDVLRYKLDRCVLEFPSTTASSVPAALTCIDVIDFDNISSDDLVAVRTNEESFAAWRSDIASIIALSNTTGLDFQQAVSKIAALSTDVLPRRAAEIEAAIKKTSLKQHISDAAYGFGAAALSGLREGNLEKALTGALTGSAAGLLMSILFRRPPREKKTLHSLYTMLAKKDKKTGWVTPM